MLLLDLPSFDFVLSLPLLISLSDRYFAGGGFGPVVADGYGIGYGVRDDVMGFNISTYRCVGGGGGYTSKIVTFSL